MKIIREKDGNKENGNKHDITDFNTYLFHQGKNFYSYDMLGSKFSEKDGQPGVRFTVWAPKAKNVYVIGDFNGFSVDENYKMIKITNEGIWSIFVYGINLGAKYKYAVEDRRGEIHYKMDPYSIFSEVRPNNASIVYKGKKFNWTDSDFIRSKNNKSIYESAVNIYEIHLGSWKRRGDEFLTYKELSKILPKYLEDMGYTHVEIMPLVEHPLDSSLGYEGIGFYSVTSRYGYLEGFKELINELHKRGIGIILDWVPSHFCKDEQGLYKFDGTPTYEYEEVWKAENRQLGTINFDLGRPEVRSFLISNALYWFREYHIDGLRIDSVSNMIYLDYKRGKWEWVPNIYGRNGNLEGIQFVKDLNEIIHNEFPNVMMIVEEAKDSWPNVCSSIGNEGLGFSFKWNIRWMSHILEYIKLDPICRKYHHADLTSSMMYNYSENFILPISHNEVVYNKKSLIDKMWGDYWTKFAGLRLFYSYMIGHPGKKLMFMGNEFGQFNEWKEYESLQWELIDKYPMHKSIQVFFKDLNHIYKDNKALWELDYDPEGFKWIDENNNNQSIISFIRRGRRKEDTLIFVSNFTPVVYYDYKIGVPYKGVYEEVLNTDHKKYGGSGQIIEDKLFSEDEESHNFENSIKIKVPPMATVVLKIKFEGEN